MKTGFAYSFALALSIGLSVFPRSTTMGATGFYYHFGFPLESVTLKNGTMGDPNVMNGWFFLPDVVGIVTDLSCWFGLFLVMIWIGDRLSRRIDRRSQRSR